jgi:signal transduction histidine kinase
MKSLFARIFVAFWVALLLMAGLAVLVTTRNFSAPPGNAQNAAKSAQLVLKQGGVVALRQWLRDRNAAAIDSRLLILGPDGVEIDGAQPGRSRPPGQGPGRPPPPRPPGTGPEKADFNASLENHQAVFRDASSGGEWRVIFDPPPPRPHFGPPFSLIERWMLVLLALVTTALAAYLVARSIGTPLQQLQLVSARLADGELSARPEGSMLRRSDEIGALGRGFDTMADRLAMLLNLHKHLLRELSHEMRSPLARMRVALDLIEVDPALAQASLARIAAEADRLESLASSVLGYARLEQETRLRRTQSVDLVVVAANAISDVRFELRLPPEAFVLSAPPVLAVEGDALLLQQAVENLLRNAASHGRSARPVAVSIQAEPEVRLRVCDHGSGVVPADVGRLFMPFTRLGNLESDAGSATGNGLGLAIVAQIAKLHGGSVRAENATEGGLSVELILPSRPVS